MKKTLDIIIPCYNEQDRISSTIVAIQEFQKKLPNYETSIIVVNDGSTDDTEIVLNKFQNIKVLSYDKNRGKGYALRAGVTTSTASLIYLCDADLSSPIEEIQNFLIHIDENDVVIGSRNIYGAQIVTTRFRKFMGFISNKIINLVLGLNLTDTQCGFKMLKSTSKPAFLECKNDRWGYDFEFLYLAKQKDLKVKEIPVKWNHKEGSKVKKSDYIKTFKELINVLDAHEPKFRLLKHFLNYVLIGIMGLLWDMGTFYILNTLLLVNIYIANLLSMTIGFTHNFLWNTFINFRQRNDLLKKYLKFASIAIGGIVVSTLIIHILYTIIGFSENISKIISLVVVVVGQFYLNAKFTFAQKR
jgi:dolichyl-phosphate beta-glucosyltransferase